MELKMFNFINEAVEYLEGIKGELEYFSEDIEKYFEEILLSSNEGYLNINSRVKSVSSLREKILRNNYYKKYKTSEDLILNLSDLIGIRIECRFIEDETKIYKVLKKYFNKHYSDGYYYNISNEKIRLELSGKQPQEQKNGFKIFRIDGIYECDNKIVNFELQIKSLVNIFWGEIEHKVIYKNNNYTAWDQFIKDILGSIKQNLSMIDNQLLLIFNQFNKLSAINPQGRKLQLEMVLSKIIYEMFSVKMKNSIGMVVNFKKSCDTIMKYIFRTNNAENLEDYNETLIKTMSRLNEIGKNEISFNSKIKFEREIMFEDEFSSIIGNTILNSINSDFQWNLFFRILFEIELGNNAEDFESFVKFIKNRFSENKGFLNLFLNFEKEEVQDIVKSIMNEIACSFKKVDSISFIYDHKIEEINEVIEDTLKIIFKNVDSYEEWQKNEHIYLEVFGLNILCNFDYEIDTKKAKKLLEEINNS